MDQNTDLIIVPPRALSVPERMTDKIITPGNVLKISGDMCARVNALINTSWSSMKLYTHIPEDPNLVRVLWLKPSGQPGSILVQGHSTVFGEIPIEVGYSQRFELFFI